VIRRLGLRAFLYGAGRRPRGGTTQNLEFSADLRAAGPSRGRHLPRWHSPRKSAGASETGSRRGRACARLGDARTRASQSVREQATPARLSRGQRSWRSPPGTAAGAIAPSPLPPGPRCPGLGSRRTTAGFGDRRQAAGRHPAGLVAGGVNRRCVPAGWRVEVRQQDAALATSGPASTSPSHRRSRVAIGISGAGRMPRFASDARLMHSVQRENLRASDADRDQIVERCAAPRQKADWRCTSSSTGSRCAEGADLRRARRDGQRPARRPRRRSRSVLASGDTGDTGPPARS